MAEENRAESLPSGWVKNYENRKDGSKAECYRNLETGQTFYSKEELLHYVHYATRILPLINEGKLTFKDFIKMPAEGSKGKAAAENSSVSTTPADGMPQDHPKGNDKGKRKAEGRGRHGKK